VKVRPSPQVTRRPVLVGSAYAEHFYDTPAALSQKYGVEIDAGLDEPRPAQRPQRHDRRAAAAHGQPHGDAFEQIAMLMNNASPRRERAAVPERVVHTAGHVSPELNDRRAARTFSVMRAHTYAASLLAILFVVTGCATKPPSRPTNAIDPKKLVDLSYTFGPETIYWPTAEPFKLQRVAYGRTPKGYFYAANNISMAEHGGTHMDAPIHFAEGHRKSAEVPLANCVGPAVVLDVREQCAKDDDYLLTADDVRVWEQQHGKIPRGAVAIMYSGWGSRWPDKKRYLGTDKPLDVDNLRFPGFSMEAVAYLIDDRDVAAIAIDTAALIAANRRTLSRTRSSMPRTSRRSRMWRMWTSCRQPARRSSRCR
jgi:kynurenine formamidase